MTLFLTLGRHKRLFRGWLAFAGLLMPGGRLPRADSEVVILRVAHLRGSAYERGQHERIGRGAGLSGADVARTTEGPDAPGWTPRQAALLAATDQLVLTRDVEPEDGRRTQPELIAGCPRCGYDDDVHAVRGDPGGLAPGPAADAHPALKSHDRAGWRAPARGTIPG